MIVLEEKAIREVRLGSSWHISSHISSSYHAPSPFQTQIRSQSRRHELAKQSQSQNTSILPIYRLASRNDDTVEHCFIARIWHAVRPRLDELPIHHQRKKEEKEKEKNLSGGR